MDSERIERIKFLLETGDEDWIKEDEILRDRIIALLNDPRIDDNSVVDAIYHDFSEIPYYVFDNFAIANDAYLIYGISEDRQIISKWVNRYDLDSIDPIKDGEIIRKPFVDNACCAPEVKQKFDKNLLSTPCANLNVLVDSSE